MLDAAMTDPANMRRSRSGSQKRQRDYRPSMVCDAGEFAQLQAAAERAGMSISSFMRHQCFGTPGPRAVRRPPIERTILAQLLAQLGKCGSNVNQVAHVLNAGGEPPAYIAATMAELRAAGAAISRALGRPER